MMGHLIVKLCTVMDESSPIVVLTRVHALRDPKVSTIVDMLKDHGLEAGQIGGTYRGFPMVAIAYTSPNDEGIGRAGSQVLRLPVRRKP